MLAVANYWSQRGWGKRIKKKSTDLETASNLYATLHKNSNSSKVEKNLKKDGTIRMIQLQNFKIDRLNPLAVGTRETIRPQNVAEKRLCTVQHQ